MKKFLILGVVVVVALAALSVGYALWSKTLTITGTVETGTFDVDWSYEAAYDTDDLTPNVCLRMIPPART